MGMQQAPTGSRVGNQNLPGSAPMGAPLGTPMGAGGYAGSARPQNANLLGAGYGQDPNFPQQAQPSAPRYGGGGVNFGDDPTGSAGGGMTAGPTAGMPVGAIASPVGGYFYGGQYYQTGQNPYATPQPPNTPGASAPAPPGAPETPPYSGWQYGAQPDPNAQSIEDFLFGRFSGPGAYDTAGYALDPGTMRGIPMDAYRRMQQLGTWDTFRFSPEWLGYQGPMAGQTMMVDPSFDFSRWTTPPQRQQAPARPAAPMWQQRRVPNLLDQIGGP